MNNTVKVEVQEEEILKIVRNTLETFDKNNVTVNEITLHITKEDGTKVDINLFKDTIEFWQNKLKEK